MAASLEIPFLADFSDTHAKELLAYAKIRRYGRRHMLINAGSTPEFLYLIMHGWIRVYTETVDGKESVIELLNRGGLLGHELILGDGAAQDYNADIVSDEVTLLEIPAAALRDSLMRNPATAHYLLALLAAHIQRLRAHIGQLSAATAVQRTAEFLLRLHEKDGKAFVLPCGKTQIANYLGMNRETLSRTLGQLKRHGVSVRDVTITIQSEARLRRYADLPDADERMLQFA